MLSIEITNITTVRYSIEGVDAALRLHGRYSHKDTTEIGVNVHCEACDKRVCFRSIEVNHCLVYCAEDREYVDSVDVSVLCDPTQCATCMHVLEHHYHSESD